MHIFNLNQIVYYEKLDIKGKIIDVDVDVNTRYHVDFGDGQCKILLAKDLQLVEGKILATDGYVKDKIEELKTRVEKLDKKVKLCIIRVEGDEASVRYVKNKEKRCKEVGIESETILLPNDVIQEEVKNKIEELNSDDNVNGILLQLPLPKQLNEQELLDEICPLKDCDSLTSWNIGKIVKGETYVASCTSKGIIQLLKYYNVDLKGKTVIIVNDSVIVGRSLAMLLLNEKATPIICHKETRNLKEKIKIGDIIVLATGNANFMGAKDFREGQIVIDVSINVGENGKLCGDIKKEDYNKLLAKGVSFTTVPFGIGQTTVISLIENVVEIAERGEKFEKEK